jgi:hypothetical protein
MAKPILIAVVTMQLLFFAPATAFIGLRSTAGRAASKLQWLSSDSASDVSYFDTQETLLRIHLSSRQDAAFEKLQHFIRSCPFALMIPTQPMAQVPTSDGGLAIRFFRHYNDGSSSNGGSWSSSIRPDGGVRIFLTQEVPNRIIMTAKRDDREQHESKLLEEKQLVVKLLAALTGSDSAVQGLQTATPMDTVHIDSIYHKWMLDDISRQETWTLQDDA